MATTTPASIHYTVKSLSEIADYFDTLAGDQLACVRFQKTLRDKTLCRTRAEIWRDAANTIRNTTIVNT